MRFTEHLYRPLVAGKAKSALLCSADGRPHTRQKPAQSNQARAYGFCVGLIRISLTNDCGAWVTSMATA